MAQEQRRDESQAGSHATAAATEPARPLPPGVVLGPDGKPYVEAQLVLAPSPGLCRN